MTRILVIANETASREAAVSALQGASFDVLHVPDAKTGLILARQLQAAVIVCEIATAQEDGLWLLEQARCDPQLSAVPIIVLCGADERAAQRKAMKLGADDYLVKPYSAQELIEAVAARIERAAGMREAQSAPVATAAVKTSSPPATSTRTATITTMTSGLPAEVRSATVLFADIRHFDDFAERLSAEELSQLLQKFFSAACEPIVAQGGRVIKFLGGGLLALFEEDPNRLPHARSALLAAHALSGAAALFRRWVEVRFGDRALPQFVACCGLHSGEVTTSTIGIGLRIERSVFGEPVHFAAVLREAAKELGCTILASRATLNGAGPGVQIAKMHDVATADGGLVLELSLIHI